MYLNINAAQVLEMVVLFDFRNFTTKGKDISTTRGQLDNFPSSTHKEKVSVSSPGLAETSVNPHIYLYGALKMLLL